MKLITRLPSALALLASALFFQPAYADPTPAGENKLRIHTSLPKKAGESLFSYTAEWRQGGGKSYHSTGMSFLDANKLDETVSAARIAKKLAAAMKESMIRLDPNWRGLVIDQAPEQAEFVLSNKAGYALTTLVFRDYTNQNLAFDLDGKNFNADGVQVAFDVVLAADVEYLDKFSGEKPKTAAQGDIEIRIGDLAPVRIKTDGKTTREIETELASQLSMSKLTASTLVTSQIGKDTRNIKPFDGSEIQLPNLAAKSISIDINDPSLGVLVKFKFKDANPGVNAEPSMMLAIVVIVVLALLALLWYRRSQNQPVS